MSRVLGMVLGLGLVVGSAMADSGVDAKALLTQARQAYDQGDYNAAITAYQKMLQAGVDQAEIFYNLGNAEYKAGHLGQAIADYRSALKRAPGDEDIQYNLQHAKRLVRQPPDPTGPLTRLLQRWLTRFDSQILTLVAWFFYLGFAVCMGLLMLRRGRVAGWWWQWLAGITGVLFLSTAAWASFRIIAERDVTWGVVVVSQSEARNGPGEENHVGFTVPEGREIRVLGREGDWVAIGLPIEGFKGWVKASEILVDR